MLIFASALAAIIPMLSYLLIIWQLDRYDKEPFKLVLQNYFWGAFGAIIFSIIGSIFLSYIFSLFSTSPAEIEKFSTIIAAPIVEEFMKGVFLLMIMSYRKFDNLTDGIVYGGAIGLGFGMTENFLYFISNGETLSGWIAIVIIRTLFSAVMHCVSTGTFGAFLGIAKYKPTQSKLMLAFAGYFVAVIIHFTWNLTVTFHSTAPLGFIIMGITIVLFITVFLSTVSGERKIILKELKSEAELGTIPDSHLEILSSPKRNNNGWIDEKIRKTYISAATTLAFRKMQLEKSTGESRKSYLAEVNIYRQFIKNILGPISTSNE
jgi:protease PrsW